MGALSFYIFGALVSTLGPRPNCYLLPENRSKKVEKKERRNDRILKKDLKRKKEEEKKEREGDSDDLDELEKDFKILKKLKKGKVSTYSHCIVLYYMLPLKSWCLSEV